MQKHVCFRFRESHHFDDTYLVVSSVLMHQSTPNLSMTNPRKNVSGEVHGLAFHMSKEVNVANGIVVEVIQAPSQATSHAVQSECRCLFCQGTPIPCALRTRINAVPSPTVTASGRGSPFLLGLGAFVIGLLLVDKPSIFNRFLQNCLAESSNGGLVQNFVYHLKHLSFANDAISH